MAVNSFESYMEDILRNIELRKTVDYGSRSSVRKYNAAYDRIIKNVKAIERNYPERRSIFNEMLSHQDAAVVYLFGCLILDRPNFSLEDRVNALDVLKKLCLSNRLDRLTITGLGFAIQVWEEKLQKEREETGDF